MERRDRGVFSSRFFVDIIRHQANHDPWDTRHGTVTSTTEIDSSIFALVAHLSRIEDKHQRGYALAKRLNGLDIDTAVEVIKAIRSGALNGDEDSLRLYNGLLVRGTMMEILGQRKLSELVNAAKERGEFDVLAVLIDLPDDLEGERPHQPYLDTSLRELPLGMRKTLARKPDFKLIQRIAKDQDHRVIEHLLNNPRLTEKDVIRIGATRPTSPRVLETIYHHPKWICRYSVKKTLACNPYAPLSLSLRLLTFLALQDLELLCTMTELDPVLIGEAKKVLEKKQGGQKVEYWLE